MRGITVDAIVLRLIDYREADVIATLFTREQGKIRGIAPGARKSRKRFGGALDLFVRLSLTVRLREGLSRIEEAAVTNLHPHIREDVAGVALAGYACELTDILLPDHMANPRYFRLLAAYLERLDSAPPSADDRLFFEINLLNILGYRPELEHCPVCEASFNDRTPLTFHASAQSLTCRGCAGTGFPVAPTVAPLLRACLATGRFGSVLFPPAERAEATNLIRSLITAHAGREPKSLRFLREVAV